MATGVWSIVSRRTFEAVTGPKVDYWLVRTVGSLATVIGASLALVGWRRRVTEDDALLGIGSALAFSTIDVYYVAVGRISRVYLVDAAAEGLILRQWLRGARRSGA